MSSGKEFVKSFWDNRAIDQALDEATITLPDRNQRLLEIRVALNFLPERCRLLDVGCGNGFSTKVYAQHVDYVMGVDYSREMIEKARQDYGATNNLEFKTQDVLELDFEDGEFDAAISQRCLINLTSWENQQKALNNVARCLRVGGYYFMQEGTSQGRDRLNEVREGFGLERMPSVPYNLDFDEEKLWPFIDQDFEIVEIRRFGYYDLISRVVHPLLTEPDPPQYDAKINEIAAKVAFGLDGAGELSRQFFAVLRRK